MKRTIAMLAAVAALAPTLCAPVAHARPDAPATSAADKKKEAGERFKRGTEFYEEGNHQAALIELERAYALAPNWRVLFNIGQVHYQLQDYPSAISSFERYLAEGDTKIPAARRAVVESDLKKLRARVATLSIQVDVVGAEVRIDNKTVGLSPLDSLTVSAGRRELTISKAGHETFSKTLDVAGGDASKLDVTLKPLAVTPPPPPSPPTPTPVPSTTESESNVPWAAWGITGGLAVGAVVFGVLALDSKSTLDDEKTQETTLDELNSQADRTLALGIATDVFIGGAAISGLIATILTATAGSDSDDNDAASGDPLLGSRRATASPTIDVTVGPTSLTVSGTF